MKKLVLALVVVIFPLAILVVAMDLTAGPETPTVSSRPPLVTTQAEYFESGALFQVQLVPSAPRGYGDYGGRTIVASVVFVTIQGLPTLVNKIMYEDELGIDTLAVEANGATYLAQPQTPWVLVASPEEIRLTMK